jgi:hypothetical protein
MICEIPYPNMSKKSVRSLDAFITMEYARREMVLILGLLTFVSVLALLIIVLILLP